MSEVNIFEAGHQIDARWAKFEKVGDQVQGTYIGQRMAVDGYNNEQVVYELKQSDGGIVNVGVMTNKTNFIDKMKLIRYGQIVGIRYAEEKPAKSKPGKTTKILTIFADPKIVDEEWLKNHSELQEMQSGDMSDESGEGDEAFTVEAPSEGSMSEDAPPFDSSSTPVAPTGELTDAQKIQTISELAKAKLNVTDPMQVKDRVMETTGLAFVSFNLDKIIEALKQLA